MATEQKAAPAKKPHARAVGVFSVTPPARSSLAHPDNAMGQPRSASALAKDGKAPVKPAAHTAKRQKITKADILPFGAGDCLPVEVAEVIAASGTATTCRGKIAKFLAADGFTDKVAAKLKVNSEGQTADALLAEIASYAAPYLSDTGVTFALRIKYANDGTTGEVYNEPISWVRKLKDGRFVLHPKFGKKKFNLDEAEVLDAYDPTTADAVLAHAAEKDPETGEPFGQPGQLLYVHTRSEGSEDYPVPTWWAGVNDLRSDAEISAFDLDQIKGGFFPSSVLTMLGETDDEQQDEYGKTEKDYLKEKLDGFTGKDRKPGELRNSLLVLEADTKEMAPQLQSIDPTAVLKALGTKRDDIGRAVCRHMGVPPPLAHFAEPAILGNQQAMANATRLLQATVVSAQGVFQATMERLFPDRGPWPISTLNLFSFLPPEVWAKLTNDEIREAAGYKGLVVGEKTAAEKTAEKLATLSPLVANKVLDSMTEEEIRALVELGPKTTSNTTA